MPPDLALSSTLTGSNYPCLELIFMVPKVFEPLKFDCRYICFVRDKTHLTEELLKTDLDIWLHSRDKKNPIL